MRDAEQVIAELRSRGDLWEHGPGLVGLRGATLRLYGTLERAIARTGRREASEAWQVPAGIPFETLARAEYFASFPQWLTAAAHLGGDERMLESVAGSADPGAAAAAAMTPTRTALPPAVCYHVWQGLAGVRLTAPRAITASGTCWRHETGRFAPLERGWAFTMREFMIAGSAADVAAFRAAGIRRARSLALRLGLDHELVVATDPFFAPTSRGKALLQRVKSLKHELLLPIGAGRAVAATSFNDHERFFGDAFDIRRPDGSPAFTGCVAYGVERWLLAFLARHGTNPGGWPRIRRNAPGSRTEWRS